jgi:hypothetical protein
MGEARSSLIAAGNTYNPSLITLRTKGYFLWTERLGDERNLWCARKEARDFAGYTPIELLGVVALWEHLGEAWNQQSPDILDELLDEEG